MQLVYLHIHLLKPQLKLDGTPLQTYPQQTPGITSQLVFNNRLRRLQMFFYWYNHNECQNKNSG